MSAVLPPAITPRKGREQWLKGLLFIIPLCMQHTLGSDTARCSCAALSHRSACGCRGSTSQLSSNTCVPREPHGREPAGQWRGTAALAGWPSGELTAFWACEPISNLELPRSPLLANHAFLAARLALCSGCGVTRTVLWQPPWLFTAEWLQDGFQIINKVFSL